MAIDENYRYRRTILSGLSVAITAGCLGWPSDELNLGQTESATPSEGGTSQPTAANFYIENVHSGEVTLSLDVTHDDFTLVDDEFAIPGSTGVVFRDLGKAGTTYSVSASTKTGDHGATAEWDVRSCAESEAPKGNTDGGVRYSGDDLLFRQNACDAIFIGTKRITYEDPDKYRI